MSTLEKLLIICGLTILVCFGMYRWGHANGAVEGAAVVQADWDKEWLDIMQVNGELIAQHQEEIAQERAENEKLNKANKEKYEANLQTVTTALDAARAESKRLGGLRIPAPACPSGQAGGQAQANGAEALDGAATGTIALPEQIEADLWSAAGYADEIVERARALQEWINAQQFPVEK